MDLKDATLMFVTESAAYPAVAELARSAYDRLADEGAIDYRVLDELVGEAGGRGRRRAQPLRADPGRIHRAAGRGPADGGHRPLARLPGLPDTTEQLAQRRGDQA